MSRAKRAAAHGPVFITDRGRLAHVLLTAAEYARLSNGSKSLAEILSDPASAHIDFDSPKMGPMGWRIPDFDERFCSTPMSFPNCDVPSERTPM